MMSVNPVDSGKKFQTERRLKTVHKICYPFKAVSSRRVILKDAISILR